MDYSNEVAYYHTSHSISSNDYTDKIIFSSIFISGHKKINVGKESYAPPPNMDAPHGGGYKTTSGSSQPYPQPGAVPYGYPSSTTSPQDQYVPNADNVPIVKGFEFTGETIRRGFIRKVYSILSMQLLFTLGVVMAFAHHDATREYAMHNVWLLLVAVVTVFVTLITLSCCEGMRRTSPHNVIFLTIFTIGESILVGYSTLRYPADTVSIGKKNAYIFLVPILNGLIHFPI